jgi:hypothetical protein
MLIFKIILIIILVIFTIIVFVQLKNNYNDVIYVKSDVDGEQYLVRNKPDKQVAANMLAKIKQNIYKITKYMNENKDKYKDYSEYIDQLNKRIHGTVIMESSENNIYTSYSVNKGEEIIFCLRSKDIRNNKGQIHDINLVMYVVLHEISHVACPEYGHGELFKKIFAFITNIAIEQGLYTKIEFGKEPHEYCGMEITDSII